MLFDFVLCFVCFGYLPLIDVECALCCVICACVGFDWLSDGHLGHHSSKNLVPTIILVSTRVGESRETLILCHILHSDLQFMSLSHVISLFSLLISMLSLFFLIVFLIFICKEKKEVKSTIKRWHRQFSPLKSNDSYIRSESDNTFP